MSYLEFTPDGPLTVGNAYARYNITGDNFNTCLVFQNGPIPEVGINGLTNEILLEVIIDRLESFQSSKYICDENAAALEAIRKALNYLELRTLRRKERNVEGTYKV